MRGDVSGQASHPLVWQLSLTDAELDQLLAFREARETREGRGRQRVPFLRRGHAEGSAEGEGGEGHSAPGSADAANVDDE